MNTSGGEAISGMQKTLEKAMDRAARADDSHLAGQLRELGRRLVLQLNGMVRMGRIHNAENEAFSRPAKEIHGLLSELVGLLGVVHLVVVEGHVYLNDTRLRCNVREQELVDSFSADMQRHSIGGISFHHALASADVKTLAIALSQEADPKNARKAITQAVGKPDAIELKGTHRFRVSGEPELERHDYQAAIQRGSSAVHEAVKNLAHRRVPNPLQMRRVVIDLVEGSRARPDRAAATPLLLKQGSVGERHLLSVTNLAVLLGEQLGLSEAALSDLGVAAGFHDVGYTQRPDKSGHGIAGMKLLITQRGFHEAKVRRLLCTLEHHMPYEGEGLRPSLFARIIKVVDDYDVLTAARPSLPPPLSPAAALGRMWSKRGSEYDPTLLALFAQIMGRFPPGTLLELSDKSWGLVLSGGRERAKWSLPVVCIVRDEYGQPTEGAIERDLYELRATLRPVRVLEPSVRGIDAQGTLADIFEDSEDEAPFEKEIAKAR